MDSKLLTRPRWWVLVLIGLVVVGLVVALIVAQSPSAKASPDRNAYVLQSAASYDSSGGKLCEAMGGVGCADKGDWVRYDRVQFGSESAVKARVTLAVDSKNAGMPVEIRTGSAEGTVIGSFTTMSTGGASTTVTVPIDPTTGTQSIVLRFPGDVEVGPVADLSFATNLRDVPAGTRNVSPDFFGMTLEQPAIQEYPTVPFETVRAWGTYPDVVWKALHTGPGTFDWTNLDEYVENALEHDLDIIYVFGHVPGWASSNPTGECDVDPIGTCYPPDITHWEEFVKAITERYEGKIKYWELWNEPDAINFWTGTPAQLVELSRIAYPIIKENGGTVIAPSPQGKYGPVWMSNYLEAGGAPYADINAFHSYVYDAPEAVIPLIDEYHKLFANYKIDNRRLWDTEHSWGEPDAPFGDNEEDQAAWLARLQMLSFSEGIDRSIWYGWEHDGWGTLFSKQEQKITKPGIAYGEVHNWMVNADAAPCTQEAGVYRCSYYRGSIYEGIAAWAATGTESFVVPEPFIRYRTIFGETVEVEPGSTVLLGSQPFLFEK